MLKTFLAGATLAAGAVCVTACSQPNDPPPASEALEGKTYPLTPAVIAMRWQLLNPDVNSFIFRELDTIFETRPVPHSGEVWDLPKGKAMAMPADRFGGGSYDYGQFAERTYTNAMLVIRDGKIVFEDYRNRMEDGSPHIAFSMSKTITSLLVGIALDQGKIGSLDDPATKYVPQLKGTGYDGVTIRQILQMRSGVAYEERYDFGANPSFAGKLHEQAIVLNKMRFADGALETKRANEPGSTFNYSTLDTMVLGWILEEATGQKLEDYTRANLWGPLGAEADGFWLADGPPGAGRALNGMGFNARLRDFGRLGELMLNDGMRGETRVIPEGWMKQATTMLPTGAPADQGFPGYGYQIWQIDDEPGAYAAVGLAGQFIYVSPATKTVIVKLSYYPPVPPPTVDGEVISYFKAIAHTPVE
ncbi:serine hydrolase [Erythrobacter sp. SG61-1L]|uniref:serine hydrolase domain-containing protein n=1 Tax=Erythrobacter sp. SG61-1L TaxID=1603897 RepID=UPI0006C90E53|nr:serine hydrolase [Erythrobacter sp. SG61-1L]